MLKLCRICLIIVLMAAISASGARAAKSLFNTATGKTVQLSALVEELADVRVIVFGERHNDPDDHTAQRTLLQALNDAGYKVALGMEMFRADSQPMLDGWIAGKLDEASFASVFAQNWNDRFYAVYHPLLYYARQEWIKLVGLNIPNDLPSKVGREGFSSLSRRERERLGEVSCDIDDKYKDVLARAIGEKKAPKDLFSNFCEAQVLWDASMAQNAVGFLKANPGYKLLILAGNYHAWKFGIPERLSRKAKLETVVILPSDDPEFVNYKLMADEADYIWNTQ